MTVNVSMYHRTLVILVVGVVLCLLVSIYSVASRTQISWSVEASDVRYPSLVYNSILTPNDGWCISLHAKLFTLKPSWNLWWRWILSSLGFICLTICLSSSVYVYSAGWLHPVTIRLSVYHCDHYENDIDCYPSWVRCQTLENIRLLRWSLRLTSFKYLSPPQILISAWDPYVGLH